MFHRRTQCKGSKWIVPISSYLVIHHVNTEFFVRGCTKRNCIIAPPPSSHGPVDSLRPYISPDLKSAKNDCAAREQNDRIK